MVAYGEEGLAYGSNSLLVSGNVFTSTDPAAIGVNNSTSTVVAAVSCNAFDGVPTPTEGPVDLTGNAIDGPLPACGVPEPPLFASWLAGGVVLLAMRWRG